jgi:hypothetical protein
MAGPNYQGAGASTQVDREGGRGTGIARCTRRGPSRDCGPAGWFKAVGMRGHAQDVQVAVVDLEHQQDGRRVSARHRAVDVAEVDRERARQRLVSSTRISTSLDASDGELRQPAQHTGEQQIGESEGQLPIMLCGMRTMPPRSAVRFREGAGHTARHGSRHRQGREGRPLVPYQALSGVLLCGWV